MTLRQALTDLAAETKDGRIGDPVLHPWTVSTSADDRRTVEQVEVPRHRCVRRAEGNCDVLDGGLATAVQVIEDFDPHRLSEQREPLSDQVHRELGQRGIMCSCHYLSLQA